MNDHMGNPLGIIGNEKLLSRLTRDIRDNNLSHAYILDGKPGSGRHLLARHVAAAIACHHRPGRRSHAEDAGQMGFFDDEPALPLDPNTPIPCGACEGCRKVLENICPDLHVIGREGKATLGVDAVRRIRENVHLAPGDLDTKIYVIEDAETMTPQAQNALLLTLEEPPPYVLFLLLCNGTENLLETIRSRAPVLHTSPLSDEDIRACLARHSRSLPKVELEALLVCADGCAGQALTLSDPKAMKSIMHQRALVDTFMEGCAHRMSGATTSAIHQFGSKRDEVVGLLSLISLAIRDLLLLKKTEASALKYYTDREAAVELSSVFTSRSLLSLYQAISRAQDELSRNGNVRLTLTHMCLEAGILS